MLLSIPRFGTMVLFSLANLASFWRRIMVSSVDIGVVLPITAKAACSKGHGTSSKATWIGNSYAVILGIRESVCEI